MGGEGGGRLNDVPNAEESKSFWAEIRSVRTGHISWQAEWKGEWLKDLKNELENDNHLQERMVISVEKVAKQCRKMPNWKTL